MSEAIYLDHYDDDGSVKDAVKTIVSALDVMAVMAINDTELPDILEAEPVLRVVRTRIHLILDLLDARRDGIARFYNKGKSNA